MEYKSTLLIKITFTILDSICSYIILTSIRITLKITTLIFIKVIVLLT